MATPKHPESVATSSTPVSAVTKTASEQKDKPNSKTSKKNVVWYVIFALAWVLVSMIASQYIIALPMVAMLGEKITQPLWTCVYDALVYILALVLVVFVPPLLYRTYQKSHSKKTDTNAETGADKANKLEARTETEETLSDNPFSTNRDELGVQKLPTFVDIGLAPIGYVVYMVIATALTTIMSVFTWFNPEETQDVGFSYLIAGFDRFIAMIALVIIAPLAEEIIMRGWLYGKVRSKLKVVPAILLVSVLFGLLHGQWNVAVSTFALSIVLCGLREITGTIWSGVLLHMLSNGIAFYLLYISGM